MFEQLQVIAKTDIRYVYANDPTRVASLACARQLGANCEVLPHLLYDLPPDLRCYELYQDKKRFADVDGRLKPGDVLVFGEQKPRVDIAQFIPVYDGRDIINWSECALTHIGVYFDKGLVLHLSPEEGGTALWSFDQFAGHPRYGRLYRVARHLGAAPTLSEVIQYSQ